MNRPKHKYGAQPTVVDNIRFASKKEAARYGELKLLEKAGQIEELEIQPEFPLMAALTTGRIRGALRATTHQYPVLGRYIGDFRYHDLTNQRWIVEDVKGFKTPLYRWKKRHVEAQYGITIVEI